MSLNPVVTKMVFEFIDVPCNKLIDSKNVVKHSDLK